MSSSEFPEPTLDIPLLPPLHDQPFAHISEYQQAYNYIVAAERHMVGLYNSGQSDGNLQDRVMCVRIVGLFLAEFYKKSFVLGELPCLGIIHRVCVASQSLESGEDRIVELGELYRDYLIRGFLIARRDSYERYTVIYPCDGHDPDEGVDDIGEWDYDGKFETLDDIGRRCLEEIGDDYRAVSRKVFARDNCRCVVTGVLDSFWGIRRRCHELPSWLSGQISVDTLGGLIISDYMVDPIPKKGFSSARFLEVMEDLQLQDLVTDFMKSKGGSVYNPRNMLTMTMSPLALSHALGLWFEPTADPCEYTTHLYTAAIKKTLPLIKDKVRLESRGGIPPPDRRLLTFHGICSRVGILSGAAYWEYEESDDELGEPRDWDSEEEVRRLSTKL